MPVGAVKELAEVLDGDLVRSNDMVVSVDTTDGPLHLIASPIRFDDAETEYRTPPRLDEHADELLTRFAGPHERRT